MNAPIVTVEHGTLTATVRVPDHRADLTLRRAVPATGRELVDVYCWSVWSSRLGPLLAALRGAGYDVSEVGR